MAMLGAKFDPNDPRYLQPNMGAAQIPASLPTAPQAPQSGLDTSGLASVAAGMPQMAPRKPGMNWLGILADALSGAMGQPGQFAARQERQHETDQSNELYDKRYAMTRADHLKDDQTNFQQQLDLAAWKLQNDPSPMVRDAHDWMAMTPAEREAYQAAQMAKPHFGVDPASGSFGMFQAGGASPGGPAVGTVQGGYRFKGGNPADQNSWEPVGGAGGNVSGNFPR